MFEGTHPGLPHAPESAKDLAKTPLYGAISIRDVRIVHGFYLRGCLDIRSIVLAVFIAGNLSKPRMDLPYDGHTDTVSQLPREVSCYETTPIEDF